MTDAESADWWRDQAHRRMDECQRLTNEVGKLNAQLDEVRRLLLPHPDAEHDVGCGCDMHDAVSAAAWAGAEMRRLREEVEQATAVARTLVTLFPDLPELLGGRHKQPAFELMVDAKRVVENNGGNQ